MAHEIFVSYSQPDRDCALELTAHIEAEGLSVWIAPRDVSPAADWAAEIIDALSAARIMVLVFSASSNESPQVRREVERAVYKQLRILPFRIEEVLPSRSLEYFLSAQHWLDAFPPPRQPHYARLCAHLRHLLHDSALPLHAAGNATAGAAPPAGHFDAGQLQGIEAQLALHIGPVAHVLVRRAASAASDFDQLTRSLAAEIEIDSDRRRFVEACALLRQSHR